MNVADAMTPRSEVVTVELPGTRDDVLTYLQERQFSSVPVVKDGEDGEEYRGLLSREALINHPDEDQLALLMDETVPTTTADAAIEDVARLMVEEGARRVPVVDGRLEGIVTVTDVVTAIARGEAPGDAAVGDLATRVVTTTHEDTPLPVVERQLSYADTPYAVVLGDDAEMTGIVTEVDIIDVARVVAGETDTGDSIADQDDEWMWEGIKAVGARYMPTRDVEIPAGPVSEFMTADVVTVGNTRTAREAAQLMLEHDVEQIPLVSEGRLAGVVRDVDLLRAIYE
jgi:CBS domain-containing protein